MFRFDHSRLSVSTRSGSPVVRLGPARHQALVLQPQDHTRDVLLAHAELPTELGGREPPISHSGQQTQGQPLRRSDTGAARERAAFAVEKVGDAENVEQGSSGEQSAFVGHDRCSRSRSRQAVRSS